MFKEINCIYIKQLTTYIKLTHIPTSMLINSIKLKVFVSYNLYDSIVIDNFKIFIIFLYNIISNTIFTYFFKLTKL